MSNPKPLPTPEQVVQLVALYKRFLATERDHRQAKRELRQHAEKLGIGQDAPWPEDCVAGWLVENALPESAQLIAGPCAAPR